MNIPPVIRLRRSAILIPGLLFGTLIWAAISGGSAWLTAIGQAGGRATLFMTTMLTAVPLMMIAAGAMAEWLAGHTPPAAWKPSVPYLAGFLAGLCAGCLSAIESGMTQYLPLIEPGLIPRLAFALGRVIMYMPFVAVLGALFALFALVGGYCTYRMREKVGPCKE